MKLNHEHHYLVLFTLYSFQKMFTQYEYDIALNLDYSNIITFSNPEMSKAVRKFKGDDMNYTDDGIF